MSGTQEVLRIACYHHHQLYFTDKETDPERRSTKSLKLVTISQIEIEGNDAIFTDTKARTTSAGSQRTLTVMEGLDFSAPHPKIHLLPQTAGLLLLLPLPHNCPQTGQRFFLLNLSEVARRQDTVFFNWFFLLPRELTNPKYFYWRHISYLIVHK